MTAAAVMPAPVLTQFPTLVELSLDDPRWRAFVQSVPAVRNFDQPLAAVAGGQRRAERQGQDDDGAAQRQLGGKAVGLARGIGRPPHGFRRGPVYRGGTRRLRGRLRRGFRLSSRSPPHRRGHTHPP